ncbi:DnaD domain-containing protein [Aggregatilinea lenta]|uniref:DnaD domain-containing protein n=1 Tax=Aggregatilinea lenta TaxID=913108 RepID=UPI000E5A6F0B|nr:DnaD domain protein [Aggregatilinea lenta]
MRGFSGFPPGKTLTVALPNQFFTELLQSIDDLIELKLTLYCFWALHQQDGEYRYVIRREVLDDALFLSGIDADAGTARERAIDAFERATARGTLLHVTVEGVAGPEDLYFLNTTRGRNAIRAIEQGHFTYGGRDCPVALVVERPNIFSLYEQNIGPLTPMISGQLKQAEDEYPAEWIEEAIRLAVERNARSWRYISAILNRWQTEGKDGGQPTQPTEADHYRYIRGEYSDIIDY